MWGAFWHHFAGFINNLTLYNLTSGWIPCAAMLVGLSHYVHSHTCAHPGCLRPVKHSRPHCHKHDDDRLRK